MQLTPQSRRRLLLVAGIIFLTYLAVSIIQLASEPEHIHSRDDVPQETTQP